MLDDSHIILVDHRLAGRHLKNNVALRELKVLHVVDGEGIDAVEIVLRLLIHRVGVLIHSRGEPLLLTSLAIFLSQFVEVSSTLQSRIDTVSRLAGLVESSTTNLNLTIFNTIRHLNL